MQEVAVCAWVPEVVEVVDCLLPFSVDGTEEMLLDLGIPQGSDSSGVEVADLERVLRTAAQQVVSCVAGSSFGDACVGLEVQAVGTSVPRPRVERAVLEPLRDVVVPRVVSYRASSAAGFPGGP